ncbi:Glutamate--cysteine ligase [Gammaproteobacteria bacterium]
MKRDDFATVFIFHLEPSPRMPVPHLTTALDGPLLDLERRLLEHQTTIETWLRAQWQKTPAPFYASVDLRNAGFKLAPVDTNLFPAGFNNLNPAFLPLCIQAVQHAIEQVRPVTRNILIIPENHTRNLNYFQSIIRLREILAKAGFQVHIGLPPEALGDSGIRKITLLEGDICIESIRREGNRILVNDFSPCLILLNNDLAEGRPAILENLEQQIIPPLGLGWSNRLKSDHFAEYRQVVVEFSHLLEIDPWVIDPLFTDCGAVDFMTHAGEECMTESAATLLSAIQRKYDEYKLDQPPFIIVKADQGTYGMGVMTVRSALELNALNRKQRTRMATSKGGLRVSRVILQEGVYTFESWKGAVAEPVVYLIDRFVVGGFYRVHTTRGRDENLNAPGMRFEPLSFEDSCITPDQSAPPNCRPNRFYAYGVIARLALVAAARELVRHDLVRNCH